MTSYSKTARGAAALLLLALVTLAGAAAAAAQPGPVKPAPIPTQQGAQPVEEFIGAAATARPVTAKAIPDNPFLLPGSWGCIHDDTYQSDTYDVSGPLGVSPATTSAWLGTPAVPYALCVGITFDKQGYLIAAAIKIDMTSVPMTSNVQLTLMDPHDLSTLATFDLPGETYYVGFRPAGTYFYQDQLDRTVVATVQNHILLVSHAQTGGVWSFRQGASWDVSSVVKAGDSVEALAPDFAGHVWVTSKNGVVATVNATTGKVLGSNNDMQLLGEYIANGHAVSEESAAYIASDAAMYRFDADAFGRPVQTWREPYARGTGVKPGQVELGTGTTPTILGGKYVAITDNAQPYMHVLVYKCAKKIQGKRLTTSVPVFAAYKGCTENSLICTEKSIIVENNFGYTQPDIDTVDGRTTTPGVTRIDLDKKGAGHKVWSTDEVSIPSAISKMSLANGIVYCYTKPAGPGTTDPWYFTALDFRTGKVLWKQLSGTGQLYDNFYAGTYIGPDGTLYQGVTGGIVAMRDGG